MKTLYSFYLYLILATTTQAAGLLEIDTNHTPKIQEVLASFWLRIVRAFLSIDPQQFYIDLIRHLKKA